MTAPDPLFQRIARDGLTASHGEARRLVRAGVVTVNGIVATDEGLLVSDSDTIGIERHGMREDLRQMQADLARLRSPATAAPTSGITFNRVWTATNTGASK